MAQQLNYADYTFTSIVSQLQTILSSNDQVWDSYESSTATMLIELFAYVGEMLMYTAERRAQESYLATAQLSSSVIALVRLVNYQPSRNISATGILTFSVSVPDTVNIYIPKYTRVTNSAGLQFMTATDCILFAGTTSVNVNGIQGINIPFSFVSNGTAYQSYTINDTTVENTNLFVLGGTWTPVTSFVQSESNSQNYTVQLNNDETVTLNFGDNIFGMIPLLNSVMSGTYISSAGGSGNVYATGLITTLIDTITDANNNVVTLTVTNSSPFLGGANVESIEQIRYNAPRIFATANRDVTASDYIADLENYPSVAAVNVWGENEVNPPNITLFNQVVIVMLLEGYILPGTVFLQQISTYLQTRAQLTVQYQFLPPTIIQVNAIVTAVTAQSNSLATVELGITNALTTYFALGSSAININYPIRYSEVEDVIDGVNGVLYSFLSLQIQQQIGIGNASQTTFTGVLQMTNVLDSSVSVLNNGNLAGYSASANGTTSEVDASQNVLPITFNNVIISTKYYKFGTGSGKFNGTSAYLSTPANSALNLSGGIWTFDIQVNPDVLKNGTIWYQSNNSTNYFVIYTLATGAVGMKLVVSGSTVLNLVTAANQIVVGTWTHLEFCENGTSYVIFVNGNLTATTTNINTPAVYAQVAQIGLDGSSNYYSGYFDEIRLSKGIERNSVVFTPPAVAYVADTYTSLLLHLNGIGTLVAVAGSGITGTVNYTYGNISVTFLVPPPNLAPILITYQQNANNFDLIPGMSQIVELINTNVTVTYATGPI